MLVDIRDDHPHSFRIVIFPDTLFMSEPKNQFALLTDDKFFSVFKGRRIDVRDVLGDPFGVLEVVPYLAELWERVSSLGSPVFSWRVTKCAPAEVEQAQFRYRIIQLNN